MLKSIFGWYIICINVIGLLTMRNDKRKAVKGQWRVSERNLWILALLGGAPGMTVGMRMFRHKTKHFQFKYGFPVLAILDLIIYVVLLDRLS